jgi:hypothetical protein
MSEYNRGTGCEKTARPGLWRGLRVTGVPTPEAWRWARIEEDGNAYNLDVLWYFDKDVLL